MNSALAAFFVLVSQTNNLPPGLLRAVCYVESKHVPESIHRDDGGHNSIGICQLQHPTAVFMGYRGGEAGLLETHINVRVAGAYLGWELHRYHGDVVKAVAAYNSGSYRVNVKGLPFNGAYVRKVLDAWKEKR